MAAFSVAEPITANRVVDLKITTFTLSCQFIISRVSLSLNSHYRHLVTLEKETVATADHANTKSSGLRKVFVRL